MEKKFVNQLNEHESVQCAFLAKEKQLLTDKNNKAYMSVNLKDVTGTINGRVWDKAEKFADQFQEGDIVVVKGVVQVYQSRKQLVIRDIVKAEAKEYKIEDFLKTSEVPPAELFSQLLTYVALIKDEHLKKLLESLFEDDKFKERLLKTPAAKSIHHAYVGGLLEHIVSICGIMKYVGEHYNFLNLDYLIFGAIFHDIGKVWELEVSDGISYTSEGRLVGHMVIACDMLEKGASKILGFPGELKNICKHIILSHHGKLEYGSPKRPKIIEALVVSMIDELDSRLNTLHGFMADEMNDVDSWTRYNAQFDRYFYLNVLRGIEGSK